MAVVLSPQSSSSPQTQTSKAHSSQRSANLPSLPPLVTSQPTKRSKSRLSKRLSSFSTLPAAQPRSRPQSTVFPVFHSSLNYTLVRDFGYPSFHPLFYGPGPEQNSEISTPVSEGHNRLSDPEPSWDGSRGSWSAGPREPGERLPPTSFGDGPPWREDEDLRSPVVTSTRNKKHKSNGVNFDQCRGRTRELLEGQVGGRSETGVSSKTSRPSSLSSTNGDENKSYFINEVKEGAVGPSVPDLDEVEDIDDLMSSDDDFQEEFDCEENRFSRDYQFTIASPAEEMHGKAVALFDFASENENELPLVEGQVILISYRHGQGWLVAQNPKTGETGLVPEAYVRLLKDIEGGWTGLMNGHMMTETPSMDDVVSAKLLDQSRDHVVLNDENGDDGDATLSANASSNSGWYTPVVSTFSTSSKDLRLYPQRLLGSGQMSAPCHK